MYINTGNEQFRIVQTELENAIIAVGFAIDTKDQNAKIGLRLRESVVDLFAGNRVFSVTRSVLVNTDSCGFSCSVEYTDLLAICKASKGQNPLISFCPALSKVVFTLADNVVFNLPTYDDAVDIKHPALLCCKPVYDGNWWAKGKDKNQFTLALDSVFYAAGKRHIKPQYNGVNIRSDNGQITLAAMDGHRLAVYPIGIDDCPYFSCIIPGAIVNLMLKQAKLHDVSISIYNEGERGGEKIHIAFGLCFVVIEMDYIASFPDYSRILRGVDENNKMTVSRTVLLDIAKQLHTNKKKPIANLIVNNDDGLLTLETLNASASVWTGYSGGFKNGLLCGLDLGFLIDALEKEKKEVLEIICSGNNERMVFKINGNKVTHILMGCRV